MPPLRPFAVGCAALLGAAACGGRTGLLTNDGPSAGVTLPGGPAAPIEAGSQAPNPLPPINIPPPAPMSGCDGGATLIYVVTQTFDLMSFDPSTLTFNTIGRIQCPATGDPDLAMPFSMAVDQTGIAYVVYQDGELFRVSTANASCRATGFVPDQQRFVKFGMGYSRDSTGASETLYVASDEDLGSGLPPRLGWIDTTNFHLNMIAPFSPAVSMAELTGTGSGGLYAFYSLSDAGSLSPPTAIGQVDPNTADVIGQSNFSNLGLGCGWAFAFWGGDFYIFTTPSPQNCPAPSIVTRFRPSDGSLKQVASAPGEIVGAGVSTCAPVQ